MILRAASKQSSRKTSKVCRRVSTGVRRSRCAVRPRSDRQTEARRKGLGESHSRLRLLRCRPRAPTEIQQSSAERADGPQALSGAGEPGGGESGRLNPLDGSRLAFDESGQLWLPRSHVALSRPISDQAVPAASNASTDEIRATIRKPVTNDSSTD